MFLSGPWNTQVSEDERNAAESSTLIDRASAALAAVQALLNEDVMGSSRESQAFRGRPTRDNIPSWSSGSKLSLKSEPIQGPSVSVSSMFKVSLLKTIVPQLRNCTSFHLF